MAKTKKQPATPEQPKKKKYKSSRAGRCEEACDAIRAEAEHFRAAAVEVETRMEELKEPGDTITLPSDIFKELITSTEDLASPLDELRDEMQSWFDNLPESLQGADKGERIQEAASQLESAIDTLGSVDFPDVTGDDAEMNLDQLDSLKTSLEETADNLDGAADEAEATDFPGMYG